MVFHHHQSLTFHIYSGTAAEDFPASQTGQQGGGAYENGSALSHQTVLQSDSFTTRLSSEDKGIP